MLLIANPSRPRSAAIGGEQSNSCRVLPPSATARMLCSKDARAYQRHWNTTRRPPAGCSRASQQLAVAQVRVRGEGRHCTTDVANHASTSALLQEAADTVRSRRGCDARCARYCVSCGRRNGKVVASPSDEVSDGEAYMSSLIVCAAAPSRRIHSRASSKSKCKLA